MWANSPSPNGTSGFINFFKRGGHDSTNCVEIPHITSYPAFQYSQISKHYASDKIWKLSVLLCDYTRSSTVEKSGLTIIPQTEVYEFQLADGVFYVGKLMTTIFLKRVRSVLSSRISLVSNAGYRRYSNFSSLTEATSGTLQQTVHFRQSFSVMKYLNYSPTFFCFPVHRRYHPAVHHPVNEVCLFSYYSDILCFSLGVENQCMK